jgi:hypothetical protein
LSFLLRKEISYTRFLAALNDFSPNDSLYVEINSKKNLISARLTTAQLILKGSFFILALKSYFNLL